MRKQYESIRRFGPQIEAVAVTCDYDHEIRCDECGTVIVEQWDEES
jgi:hypothetical protein